MRWGFNKPLLQILVELVKELFLPSVFRSPIRFAYLNAEDRLELFERKEESQGVCYVGPSNKVKRIVNFSHSDYENILTALRDFDTGRIHPSARKNLEKVLSNPFLLIENLECGVEVTQKPRDIGSLAKIVFGEPAQQQLRSLRNIGLIFLVDPLGE